VEDAVAEAVTEEQVREALATVTDFDHGADVISLGMISGIAIDDTNVTFTLQVDPEEASLKEPLRQACENTVKALLGVDSVIAVLTAHLEAGRPKPALAPAPPPEAPAHVGSGNEELVAQVVEACQTVYDPEIPVNIYELGLIYRVDIDPDRNVNIEMTLTTIGCPVADILPGEVEEAVRMNVPDISDVRVNLVWDPPWTKDRMSEAALLELGFM
jgi:FeS assembly SUF system protein